MNYSFFNSVEVIDGVKYITTKKITVKEIHRVAKEIRALDENVFCAGIEE